MPFHIRYKSNSYKTSGCFIIQDRVSTKCLNFSIDIRHKLDIFSGLQNNQDFLDFMIQNGSNLNGYYKPKIAAMLFF